MGSVVTSGEGYMIATVIGDSSELGKINKALTDTSEEEERKDTSSLKLRVWQQVSVNWVCQLQRSQVSFMLS